MRKILIVMVLLNLVKHWEVACGQVTVTPDPIPEDIASFLSGPNVIISNLEINCHDTAYGFIDAPWNNIFQGQGFAMTSGSVFNIPGPNNETGAGLNLNLFGDDDLDQAIASDLFFGTYDPCIIEFDCISYQDTLFFNYVFGSEEYLDDFVNTESNDGFAVFISGSGINGIFSDSASNFALIPGTNLPICVANLNSTENNWLYVYNKLHLFYGIDFQYDGLSILMKGFVPLVAGESYHVKIVVADVRDGIFDSGVLFPHGAFRTTEFDNVGINNYEKNKFNLYPNPTTTTLTLSTELTIKNGQLKIINVQGQLIYQLPNCQINKLTIDVSQLPTGLYYLILQSDEGVVTKKFEILR